MGRFGALLSGDLINLSPRGAGIVYEAAFFWKIWMHSTHVLEVPR